MVSKKVVAIVVAGAAAAAAVPLVVASVAAASEKYESPPYKVLEELDQNCQVREYGKRVVAQVAMNDGGRASMYAAFKVLAAFIFGKNKGSAKVPMTSPVVSEPSEKIAMTAPVVAERQGSKWKMSFYMPSEYTLETLPEPADDRIRLTELPARKYAAIRFSGLWSESSFDKQKERLLRVLAEHGLTAAGEAQRAYYNEPFTLPFLRRNEILVPLS